MVDSSSVDTLVCLEEGSKRVFASAMEWPGWCRSGRSRADALEALGAYASRYAPVAALAGVRFPGKAGEGFEVAESFPGNATTDFGAPAMVAEYDHRGLDAKQAKRVSALVAGCWQYLDDVAVSAPAQLRKGPRGGGRDRDQIWRHVAEAEAAYARKLDIARGQYPTEIRAAILEVLGAGSDGRPSTEKRWPARYAARRVAWHALDHAWEIEDKS
jgi:hypothetical protein